MLREQKMEKLKTLIMNDQVLEDVAVEGCYVCVMILFFCGG